MCPAFVPAATGCGTVLRGAFPSIIGLLSDLEEDPACDAEEPSAETGVFAGRGRISAAAERDQRNREPPFSSQLCEKEEK